MFRVSYVENVFGLCIQFDRDLHHYRLTIYKLGWTQFVYKLCSYMHAWNHRLSVQVSLCDKNIFSYMSKTFKLSKCGNSFINEPISSWQLLDLSSMWLRFFCLQMILELSDWTVLENIISMKLLFYTWFIV